MQETKGFLPSNSPVQPEPQFQIDCLLRHPGTFTLSNSNAQVRNRPRHRSASTFDYAHKMSGFMLWTMYKMGRILIDANAGSATRLPKKRQLIFKPRTPESALWLDMGLGKTVITLTSIAHLIHSGFLRGVVIVAPIRVIRLVWRQEAAKWEHTKHLKFSMVAGHTGTSGPRALLRQADIYLVNYENLKWLGETSAHLFYCQETRSCHSTGCGSGDEISKMKNSTTQRVKGCDEGDPQLRLAHSG